MNILRAIVTALCVVTTFPAIAYGHVTNPVAVNQASIILVSNNGNTWTTCLSFTNETQKDITAVRFGFTYKNRLGAQVASFSGERYGIFAPGILIQGPDGAEYIAARNDSEGRKNCFRHTMNDATVWTVEVEVLGVQYSGASNWTSLQPDAVFTGHFSQGPSDQRTTPGTSASPNLHSL
jgi:hypothetical protein